MESLDSSFKALVRALGESNRLNAASHKPVFYFVYPSTEILYVRRRLPQWSSMIETAGQPAELVCFGDLLWSAIDDSKRWNLWRAAEASYDRSAFNQSVSALLEKSLPRKIEERLASVEAGSTVILSSAELLHPWLRTRALEHCISSAAKGPVVILYPGHRSGQYGLEFLGFYEVDGNYRSSMYGVEA